MMTDQFDSDCGGGEDDGDDQNQSYTGDGDEDGNHQNQSNSGDGGISILLRYRTVFVFRLLCQLLFLWRARPKF